VNRPGCRGQYPSVPYLSRRASHHRYAKDIILILNTIAIDAYWRNGRRSPRGIPRDSAGMPAGIFWVGCISHHRVHEALDNLTPADVYQGRAVEITAARNLVKEQTLAGMRRLNLGLMPMNKGLARPADLREFVLYQNAKLVPKARKTYSAIICRLWTAPR
jgi:hypothetical protein